MDRAVDNGRSRSKDDFTDEARVGVDLAGNIAFQRHEYEIGFKHIILLAGIDPVVGDGGGLDLMAGVDQPLHGVGDL